MEAAIRRQCLVKSVSRFAEYYFFMQCVEHPEIDGVLKRYLSKDVKADSTCTSFPEEVPLSGSKKNLHITKLIDQIDVVGDRFGSHFDNQKDHFDDQKNHYVEQKKRFAAQKLVESTNQYVELRVLLLKEPLLATDPVLVERMTALKSNIAEAAKAAATTTVVQSPARKRNRRDNVTTPTNVVTSVINGSVYDKSDDDDSSLSSLPHFHTTQSEKSY